MGFNYQTVERIRSIDANDFYQQYVKPQKPVVIEQLTKDWPAYHKWHFDYIKQVAGDQVVPLYGNEPVDPNKKVNEPDAQMKMRDYLDLLLNNQTDMRIFLYSLMKHVPAMQNDFEYPDLKIKLIKSLPFLFFGGKDVNVFMHYDIDLANIFHFHFAGQKRCIIVPPDQTQYMYKIPFSNICREDIDFDNPDFNKWPALKNLRPYVADLSHGEMLYMPEGYWHYMKYLTPGFSMSLRALAHKPSHILQAAWNLFGVRNYDNWQRKRRGSAWIDYKNQRAIRDTHLRLGYE